MNKAYLLTGGNLGNRLDNLHKAADYIKQYCGKIVRRSTIYETAAWGKEDQESFLNQVIQINTPLNAKMLLQTILKIEERLGRKREIKYGPRIIDIDILFFNNEIIVIRLDIKDAGQP